MSKKIVIVDGGPRKTMNTAQMLAAFAEGVNEADKDIEVKTVRLYDLDYKGCMSCMACKLKDRPSHVCKFKDELTPVLEDISSADGFVLGSPVFMGTRTAQAQALLERMAFPWLDYEDFSHTADKKMPTVFIYTMNAAEEMAKKFLPAQIGLGEHLVRLALGDFETLAAYNTYQVKNYSRYKYAPGTEQMKQQYKDAQWEKDLQKARDAGKRMAEKIAG